MHPTHVCGRSVIAQVIGKRHKMLSDMGSNVVLEVRGELGAGVSMTDAMDNKEVDERCRRGLRSVACG